MYVSLFIRKIPWGWHSCAETCGRLFYCIVRTT